MAFIAMVSKSFDRGHLGKWLEWMPVAFCLCWVASLLRTGRAKAAAAKKLLPLPRSGRMW
jgi:hypothetical protein